MPGGDRTGPRGMGPMTGRAAGYCAGYPVPGYMNPYEGRGLGMARGRGGGRPGRGFRWRNRIPVPWFQPEYPWGMPYAPPFSPYTAQDGPGVPAADTDQDIVALKQQADYLSDTLEGIQKRIDELESAKPEKDK